MQQFRNAKHMCELQRTSINFLGIRLLAKNNTKIKIRMGYGIHSHAAVR